MFWIPFALLRSVLASGLIFYTKIDNTDKFILPIITQIIIGIICVLYFIYFYKDEFQHFTKPKYYIYSLVTFSVILLTYYIIKICPNPAYFRAFVALEIIILLLLSINKFKISKFGIVGIILISIGIVLITCFNDI